MINKVSSLIMINYGNLGLDRLFDDKTIPILLYFLKKDIEVLIGKDEFESKNELPYTDGLSFKPCDGMLLAICDGYEYLIGSDDSTFFIFDKKNPNNKIIIEYDKINEIYINRICLSDETQSINEVQKIFLKENNEYEYQKTITTTDGIIKYPLYRIKLLEEVDNIEYLKIMSYDKGYNDKTIDIIKNPKIDDNLMIYFENIFSILEASSIDRKVLSLHR